MKLAAVQRGIAASVLFAAIAHAQATRTPLTFEVATIKPHAPGDNSSSTQLVSGGVDATNVTLRDMIRGAYNIQEYQILGGPKWVSDDRWDIKARTPDFVMPENPNALSDAQRKTVQEQMLERVRGLLADRFQLVAHEETKEQPIYALTVAKNGPKLLVTAKEARDGVSTNMNNGRGVATFTGATMDTLARNLARRIGRPVVDQTGLTGNYDFKLEWTADVGQPGADVNAGPGDPSAPTIFTAAQEQLGLRLESQKGPVKVLVIERIERPTDN